MKSILVIAAQPALAEEIRAALGTHHPRIIHRGSVEEAEALLNPTLLTLCLLDASGVEVQTMWDIERIRRVAPTLPIIVLTATENWGWQEDAYARGVAHVLPKPIRPRLLETIVNRALHSPGTEQGTRSPAPLKVAPVAASSSERAPWAASPAPPAPAPSALSVLRDVSAVLRHSLHSEALLDHFVQLLRELTGINRTILFLRNPPQSAADSVMKCAHAVGIPAGLAQNVELSTSSGIGGYLVRQGRILLRNSPEAQSDPEILREFELLGVQSAIPVLDRETLLGVALLDDRMVGGALNPSELSLIFHLLEELGLALKNIWLHQQLAASHETVTGVLQQLSNACLVINRSLKLSHINRAAQRAFGRNVQGRDLEFTDLPPLLANKVQQVLRNGAGIDTFDFTPADLAESVFRISIVPLESRDSSRPESVLLFAEDQSIPRQLQRLQVESARLRLLKAAGDRVAHEIGNALVPLSTHQQLMPLKFKDADFRASLETALNDGVTRINRLVTQMRFIARDGVIEPREVKLSKLVNESYEEARKYCASKSARLKCDADEKLTVAGDPAALKLAFTEAFINALQANPDDARVNVRFTTEAKGDGLNWARVEVEDNGPGFSADAAKRATEPFFTTRTVGLGLGLTVSNRIIEAHQGRLEIKPTRPGGHGVVSFLLPAAPEVSAN